MEAEKNVKNEVKEEPKKEAIKETKNATKTEKKKETKTSEKEVNYKLIGGIIIVAIIAITLVVCAAIFSNKPESAVNEMLEALKNGDFQKAEEYVNYKELMSGTELAEEEADMNEEAQKLLFDRLAWNIKDVKKDGNTATVETEITNKDFKIVISNYMSKVLKATFSNQNITESDIENYLIEELKNESVQTKTVTTTIKLEKQEGKWRVVSSEELASSLLTGLKEAMNSLNDMVDGEITE